MDCVENSRIVTSLEGFISIASVTFSENKPSGPEVPFALSWSKGVVSAESL
jgi:hypothetical protein